MTEVTLLEMLEAREARVRRQQELLAKYRRPLVCFTMNIAGPVKTSPLIERAFDEGLCALKERFPHPLWEESSKLPTGCTAFLAVDLPAEAIKEITLKLEEAGPLGRLFDMDVLLPSGEKLSRSTLRGCIVCGKAGRDCAARRLHTVEELQTATTRILAEHFADLAVNALITEAETTPKPGLVDQRNCGSHKDMDLPLFRKSAESLRPYFIECITLGDALRETAPTEAFKALRQAGLQAEKTMFAATDGINTHKGAVFIMGLLLGALGRTSHLENICQTAGELCRETMEADFAKACGKTHGEQAFLQTGAKGVRGEAAKGFPTLCHIALPAYENYLRQGFAPREAGALTLLHLIAKTEDTNLYHRGGADGSLWAKAQATALLNTLSEQQSAFPRTALERLDDQFIARNLSPGGSADLLAATYFLHALKE